jgi:hypothetical protein
MLNSLIVLKTLSLPLTLVVVDVELLPPLTSFGMPVGFTSSFLQV